MGRNLACLMIILGLSACEQIGIPDPQKQAEAEQAEEIRRASCRERV